MLDKYEVSLKAHDLHHDLLTAIDPNTVKIRVEEYVEDVAKELNFDPEIYSDELKVWVVDALYSRTVGELYKTCYDMVETLYECLPVD